MDSQTLGEPMLSKYTVSPLHWSKYRARLSRLSHATGKHPVFVVTPVVYVTHNWTPFRREDRRGIKQFAETHKVEIDPSPVEADPETGELNARFVGPTSRAASQPSSRSGSRSTK